ncbi:MAG: TolC family protein [Crocinitomicaceae bacterium]|nr:TolC family protein [Crocinitomicaceae bacterium]
MIRILRGISLILLLCSQLSLSQNEWTLQKCVDSAVVNNSKVRLASLELGKSEIIYEGDKLNFIPRVHAGASHGYNWGQTIDPFTNEFATDRVQYNNFYLSSSVALFTGLSNYYQTKISSNQTNIRTAELELAKRNITIDILTAYLQVKLNEGILNMRTKHLEYVQEELAKAELLYENERIVEGEVLEKKARFSTEYFQMVLAKNDWKKTLFLLQVTMGKEPDSSFRISDSISLSCEYSINELELEKLAQERNLLLSKQMQGQFYPSIRLNGSLGSGYSENRTEISPDGSINAVPFGNQLSANFYQSLSATLTVPIFNGTKSYAEIKINELEYQQLLIEEEQKTLELETKLLELKFDIDNNKLAYQESKESYLVSEKWYENNKMSFDLGKIDYFKLLESKDALMNAEAEMIQAKYKLIFSELIYFIYSA